MRTLFIIALSSLFLSSCIEITERIIIHENGSGNIEYRVSSNSSNSLFGAISGFVNQNIEDQLRQEAQKMVQVLSAQEGISNVEYRLEGLRGQFFVSFDFHDTKAFNNALYQMGGYKKSWLSPGYLKSNKCRFVKRNFTPWLNRYLKKEKIEMPSSVMTELITFKSEIEVPDEIRKVRPDHLSVNPNKNQVQQRLTFTEILEENISTGIKIKY
ncbi:MAG: hypothetical protein KDC05_13420 [Bacteroidales bacterium]|nr:hypothetical protein [Bacteroidales bacterium]